MNIKAINFEELRKHESFKTIESMNQSIYTYIDHIRYDVSKSVIDVLLAIGKASLRCVGLSFMKQATIAESTGYSRKTVNKALKALEDLSVIDSVRTQTKAGRPSVKVIRILPFCLERLQQAVTSNEADEANTDAGLSMIETFEPINTESKPSFKTLDKSADQVEKESVDNIDNLSPDQLNDVIPEVVVEKEFVKLAKPYFGTRKILSLSRTLQNALKRYELTFFDNHVLEAVTNAFKTTVFAYKQNHIKTNFASYFYGVLKEEFVVVKRKLVHENATGNIPFFNWLED